MSYPKPSDYTTYEALQVALTHLRALPHEPDSPIDQSIRRLEEILQQRGCSCFEPNGDYLPTFIDIIING